jgi:hypothetical protein
VQDSSDPEGLRVFYYLVQDLKALVFSLISLHFKVSICWRQSYAVAHTFTDQANLSYDALYGASDFLYLLPTWLIAVVGRATVTKKVWINWRSTASGVYRGAVMTVVAFGAGFICPVRHMTAASSGRRIEVQLLSLKFCDNNTKTCSSS